MSRTTLALTWVTGLMAAFLAGCGGSAPAEVGTDGGGGSSVLDAGGDAPRLDAGTDAVRVDGGGAGGQTDAGGGAGGQTDAGGGSGGAGSGGKTGSGGAGSGGAGSGGKTGSGGAGSGGTVLPNITVWIAGDSTVATGGAACPNGWGGQFAPLFDSRVTVKNSAVAGRSVRTWLYSVQSVMDSTGECVLDKDTSGNPILQARWQDMLTNMKAGDYLFVQFGINDSDSTCPRHVGSAAYVDSFKMMAQAALARGAHPILLTATGAISCSGSTARATRGFLTETKSAATQTGAALIDLHALSTALYNSLALCPIPGGGDVTATTGGAVGAFFCNDHTHFEVAGATQIAAVVAKALRDQKIGLSAYLK